MRRKASEEQEQQTDVVPSSCHLFDSGCSVFEWMIVVTFKFNLAPK
jgi:hypothetical protein